MTGKKVLMKGSSTQWGHAGSIEVTGWMSSRKQERMLDDQEVLHLEASDDGGVRKELKGPTVVTWDCLSCLFLPRPASWSWRTNKALVVSQQYMHPTGAQVLGQMILCSAPTFDSRQNLTNTQILRKKEENPACSQKGSAVLQWGSTYGTGCVSTGF